MWTIHVELIWISRNIFTIVCSCVEEEEVRSLLHVYYANTKVRLNDNHITIHVMDEIWNHITVWTARNELANLQITWYKKIFTDGNIRGRYCIIDPEGVGNVFIVVYWTIHIKLTQKGKSRYKFLHLNMIKMWIYNSPFKPYIYPLYDEN